MPIAQMLIASTKNHRVMTRPGEALPDARCMETHSARYAEPIVISLDNLARTVNSAQNIQMRCRLGRSIFEDRKLHEWTQ